MKDFVTVSLCLFSKQKRRICPCTRLNHLGLMLSWPSRITLQEEIQSMTEKLIAENLKQNPLIKVTGDNLDIYVKTSSLSKERRNKDLHLFTSNIIFSRVSTTDMNNSVPKVDVSELNSEKILMPEHSNEKDKLLHSYAVLIARTLCKVPAFRKYSKHVPKHVPHEFSENMSR
ncbi:hypothetical protein DPMN_003996 [Dreissena polymorpha]|uniref:Uncharacterized protein n=1 Tax=Dreissena polymorpha TaxID=45954 RepID=A0A9D4MQF4_DREPO|nr:hypothetical protein DPMN_003996 [Dreissena polymorpha]